MAGSDKKNPREADALILPVVPLRDIVIFPHMVLAFLVGRNRSINALNQAMAEDKRVLLVT